MATALLKRLILLLFSKKSFILILTGINLPGCGSTSVLRQHHLLTQDSSAVSVYFLRPGQGFMGVRGKLMEVSIDGEKLMDIAVGDYTFLRLDPGKYDMTITSWTVEGPENKMAETSRDYILELEPADSVYLLFTLEDINFWEILDQKFAEVIDTLSRKIGEELDSATDITIHLGKHVSLQFSSASERQPSQVEHQTGIGYKVESVSRETAIETTSELEPVEGALNLPLRK